MPQIKLAVSDVSGSWNVVGGASQAACVDDPISAPNDAKKITSNDGSEAIVAIDPPENPNEIGDAYLRVRALVAAGEHGDISLIATLYEGAAVIFTCNPVVLDTAWTDFETFLDPSVIETIVDFSNLQVGVMADQSTTGDVEVSSIELEISDRRLKAYCCS